MRVVALMIAALALSPAPSQGARALPSQPHRSPNSGIRVIDRGEGRSTTPNTSLTIVALNVWVGRAVFHLRCGPIGGDVPDSTKACAALDQQPELVTSPDPFVCRGGPGSHWVVQISGWLSGQNIRQSFETCWTLQMPMIEQFELTWEVLQKHLVPRRHRSVPPGAKRRFPPGVLRATDLVTCQILGYRLKVAVPIEIGRPVTVGYGGTHPIVVLAVAHNRDGSVTASCHKGNR